MSTITPPQPPTIFNLPNQLTAARFVLALVLFGLIGLEAWAWCLLIFALAAFTDWLDGYVARVQGLATSLGRVLDPLVDKVLMCGAFIFLLPYGTSGGGNWLTPWMVTVIVARELLITGLRGYLEQIGAQFGADWLGKLKMGLQCAALVAIFVVFLIPGSHPATDVARWTWLVWLRDGLIWAMLLATVLSGLQYLWKGVLLLKADAGKVL